MNNKILIIDEDPNACSYLADVLRYLGFLVDAAHCLEDALRRLQSSGYDLLILDDGLACREEKFTGACAIGRLRSIGYAQPILVMSELATQDLLIDWRERGALQVIAKPVQPKNLRQALNGHISYLSGNAA